MRKLNRPDKGPRCLSVRQNTSQNWQDLTPQDRDDIWEALLEMQGKRCAYCESKLRRTHRHIEHFQPQKSAPNQRFQWSNLFGSCNSRSHCGHYKDRPKAPAYDSNKLIRPDHEDPHKALNFLQSGKIAPHHHNSPRDKLRGETTVQVLGLNDRKLQAKRRAVARECLREVTALDELIHWLFEDTPHSSRTQENADILRSFIDEELKTIDERACAASARQQYLDLMIHLQTLEHKVD